LVLFFRRCVMRSEVKMNGEKVQYNRGEEKMRKWWERLASKQRWERQKNLYEWGRKEFRILIIDFLWCIFVIVLSCAKVTYDNSFIFLWKNKIYLRLENKNYSKRVLIRGSKICLMELTNTNPHFSNKYFQVNISCTRHEFLLVKKKKKTRVLTPVDFNLNLEFSRIRIERIMQPLSQFWK
jgi:hypothetical protein